MHAFISDELREGSRNFDEVPRSDESSMAPMALMAAPIVHSLMYISHIALGARLECSYSMDPIGRGVLHESRIDAFLSFRPCRGVLCRQTLSLHLKHERAINPP